MEQSVVQYVYDYLQDLGLIGFRMKIGILQCDQVLDVLQPTFGDYPKIMATLFAKVSPDCRFKAYRVQLLEYPQDLDECDVYITTGSRHNINDDLDWIKRLEEFIYELDQAKKMFIGICFGHQLMIKVLGGVVGTSDKGWGIGVSSNQVVHRKPWMEPFQDKLNLIASHQDQVIQLPKDINIEVLASSSFCPYYMLAHGDHFISIQGHPEFSKEYSAALMDIRRKLIPSKRIQYGKASLQKDVDDQLMARWIVNFVLFNLNIS